MYRQNNRVGFPAKAIALGCTAILWAGNAAAQTSQISTNHQILITEATPPGANPIIEMPPIPNFSGATLRNGTAETITVKGSDKTPVTVDLGYSGDVTGKDPQTPRGMTMKTFASINREGNPEVGTTSVTNFNQIDLNDVLTYSNTAKNAPKQVVVHGQLFLQASSSGFADGKLFDDQAYLLNAGVATSLHASGIDVAGLSDLPSFGCSYSAPFGANSCQSNTRDPIELDFSITLDLNDKHDIDLQLIDLFDLSLDDKDGKHGGDLFASIGANSSLMFGNTFSVTDTNRQPVCGAVIGSASGADWGSTAACQGGGSGGGVGSVPEPASWALMLLGFGGTGAALRRRRPAAIAA